MVPGVRPTTKPTELTVATAVLLLLQVPPGVASESVVDNPAQTCGIPVIGSMPGITVTTVVAIQPVGSR